MVWATTQSKNKLLVLWEGQFGVLHLTEAVFAYLVFIFREISNTVEDIDKNRHVLNKRFYLKSENTLRDRLLFLSVMDEWWLYPKQWECADRYQVFSVNKSK